MSLQAARVKGLQRVLTQQSHLQQRDLKAETQAHRKEGKRRRNQRVQVVGLDHQQNQQQVAPRKEREEEEGKLPALAGVVLHTGQKVVDKKRKKSIVEALIERRVDSKVMAIQVERKKAERAGRGIVIGLTDPSMFPVAETKVVVEEEEGEELRERERKERVPQEIIPAGVGGAGKGAMTILEVVPGHEEGGEDTGVQEAPLTNTMMLATKTSDIAPGVNLCIPPPHHHHYNILESIKDFGGN